MTRKVDTIGGLRIEISEECIGSAQCVPLAPDVFQLDDDGYAVLTDGAVGAEGAGRARDAGDVCPMGAILVGPAEQRQLEK